MDDYNVPALTALGTAGMVGGTDYLAHRYYGVTPKVTIPFKINNPVAASAVRSGIAGLATYGLMNRLDKKLNRAMNSETKEIPVMEQQYPNYPGTEMKDFMKTAAARLGNSVYQIPVKIASDAYEFYSCLPEENRADIVVDAYETVLPGFNKLAMQAVAANVLYDMEKVAFGPFSAAEGAAKAFFKAPQSLQQGAFSAATSAPSAIEKFNRPIYK